MKVENLAELSMLSLDNGNLANHPNLQNELERLIESVRLPQDLAPIVVLKEEDAMQLREDVVQPSLPRESLLMNSPQSQGGCFVVPKTVGED